ncbi:SDR family oxidoreductase [Streptomyces sp. 7G]|uniref:SDR family oxidoreductase n=1 Tax=Streptomyces sp. 7G TaxID=2877241 RepID=UPI001CD41F58|nr:SDR family oxidoreductase [Streptomyces sp. 7G]MCA1271048.1 SDR family oxidoreductase [Streptomyces sp. 7G]
MTYQVPDQTGKLAIITGANSGTGKEAARKLAAAGANVIMAVRTASKGETAREEILAHHPGANIEVRRIDLADLTSVETFAHSVIGDGRPVDILLNNAGVMFPPVRHETADGFELQMGSNYLGPFALTLRLLPVLLKARAPRVVTMSSGMAARGTIDFEDLNWTKSYNPTAAYSRSKLADLLLSQQLARIATAQGWNILSLGAHPGNAATGIADAGPRLGGSPSLLFRVAWKLTPQHSAEAGADPMLYAATAPDVVQGDYYGPRFNLVGRPAKADFTSKAKDQRVAERLWTESERLTGVHAVA